VRITGAVIQALPRGDQREALMHCAVSGGSAPSVVAFLRELEQEQYPLVRTKQSE
jgi:hypothetical protein